MSALRQSAADYCEEARGLRALAESSTTPALRQTLLDAAATYDKLADRQRPFFFLPSIQKCPMEAKPVWVCPQPVVFRSDSVEPNKGTQRGREKHEQSGIIAIWDLTTGRPQHGCQSVKRSPYHYRNKYRGLRLLRV
jgi:hypothetical protein